jgi:hypothetical protein
VTLRAGSLAYGIVVALTCVVVAALAFTGRREWMLLGAVVAALLLLHSAISRTFMRPVCATAALACLLGNLHGSIVYLIAIPLLFGLVTSAGELRASHESEGFARRSNRVTILILPILVIHTMAASLLTGAPWVMAATLSLTILICLMTFVLVARTESDVVSRSLQGTGLIVAVPYLLYVGSRLSEVGAGSWTKIYADSTWLNPNSLGVFFLLCASLPLSHLARRGFSWFELGSAAILVSACLATFSRSSALGLAMMVVVIISRRKSLALPVAAAVIYLFVRPPQALADRVAYTLQGGQLDDSSNTRLELWRVASQIAADHPLFGVGLPELGARLGPLAVDRSIQFAHNTAMTLMAAFGLPLALAVAVVTGRLLWDLARRARENSLQSHCLAALAAIAGLVVASMFGEPILSTPVAFVATALTANSLRREGHSEP